MTPLRRVLVEALALLILAALIAWSYRGVPAAVDGNWTWALLGVLVLAAGGHLAFLRYRARQRLLGDIAILQAASWHLVRELENYPTNSSSRRGRGRIEVAEKFALKAAEAGRPLPMGDAGTLDLSRVALDVIELNEKDGSGHWRRVNGIRRGCHIFQALFVLRNATAAFLILTDHIRIQSRYPAGAMPNLTELKMVFGLPITHPEEGLAESLEAHGLHWRREEEIMAAVAYKDTIFKGLHYTPFLNDPTTPDVTYWGDNILAQMRSYMR